MRRIIKWASLGLGAIIALIVVAAAAVALLFDPNEYRTQIAAAVEEQTGRELEIEGDIRLSLFPWLGVEVGRVALADRPGFHEEPFLEVASTDVAVRLLPLLRGRIEARMVRIEQPRARLMIDESGEANWADLAERLAAEETAEPDPDRAQRGIPRMVEEAALGGLEIRRGELLWEDRTIDDRKEVERFDLDVGAVRLGHPIDAHAEWRGSGSGLPELSGQARVRATLGRQLEALAVDTLEATLQARGPEVPGYDQRLNAAGHGEVRMGDTVRIDWPHWEVSAAGAGVSGSAELELAEAGPTGTIGWEVAPFNLRTTLSRLDADIPTTESPAALTRVEGEGRLDLDGQRLEVPSVTLLIDETRVEGDARVASWDGPDLELNLSVDAVNLDHYLPAEQRRATHEPAAPDRELPDLEAIALDLPLEPLRSLDLGGSIQVDELTVSGLRISELSSELYGADGRVGLTEASAELYQGRYQGERLLLDARGEAPRIEMDQRLEDVRFGPLLEDLLGRDWLHGRGALALEGEGGGETLHALIEDFEGSAHLDAREGSVLGLNIPHMFREGVARLRAETAPEPPEDEARTDFASLSGDVALAGGVARNDNLRLDSPVLRGRGQGEVDLLAGTVDYRLRLSVTDNLEDADGRPIRGLEDVTVPLVMSGDLLEPRIRFDLRSALTEEQRREIREAHERLREAEREVREGFQARLEQELEEQTDRSRERIRDETRSILRQLR